ncbi:MAG: KTSC domain-containing protein [Spirochaetes bacterium]|nr:MAG: KTSC domain-containing protein [Spirochaetota bacterium]
MFVAESQRYYDHTFQESKTILRTQYDSLLCSLLVIFHNGSQYLYFSVPPEVHQSLLDSPSPGKFFHSNIRGKFRHERQTYI